MPSTTARRATVDGTELLVRHWTSPETPWARLLLVHGLAEHSGRYEHVGEHLAAAGIEVAAFDQRGFGASGGRRAWVDRWSQLHDDLEHILAGLRGEQPPLPLVLYGHSLGGLIALGYVLDGRSLPDALVLSAPAVGASVPRWQRGVVGALSRVAPETRLANRLPADSLSRDPTVWDAYRADPLNEHRSTARFAALAFAEQRRVAARIDGLAIPTLVIHGGDDRLVPTDTSAVFEGRDGVTRRVHPGVRHELHNEAEASVVLDQVIAWIRANV